MTSIRKSVLDNVMIASPCEMDWDSMTGDERSRHCQKCKLNVYNVADMTRAEAERFLTEATGRVCLQIYRRKDGTIITDDCPVGLRKIRNAARRVYGFVAAAVTLVMSMALAPANAETPAEKAARLKFKLTTCVKSSAGAAAAGTTAGSVPSAHYGVKGKMAISVDQDPYRRAIVEADRNYMHLTSTLGEDHEKTREALTAYAATLFTGKRYKKAIAMLELLESRCAAAKVPFPPQARAQLNTARTLWGTDKIGK